MNVLVGDLGGTKTILAMVTDETGPHILLNEMTYASVQYESLEAIMSDYLKNIGQKIDSACLAVAGPIVNGCAAITNLSWIVDAEKLQTKFGLESVKLINDLESVAYAIPILESSDLHTLQEGAPIEGGNVAIVAPGTGLGEAFLTGYGTTNRAHPSEGSHVSFGPTNETQMNLLTYMREKKGFDHVSYERVCSGALGIPNIYDFLKDTGRETEPEWLKESLAQSEDPTPIIIKAANEKKNPCKICVSTLELFRDILAAEAGNLALKVLSTGGVYLGGGIPPRILEYLKKPQFLEILKSKGRFVELLSKMPMKVILNSKAGLLGAAACGLN
ncbi:MAG: glucokinase [Ignavibacteria bacterium]|jgi:glucokinase